MKKSSFEFQTPYLKQLDYQINEEFNEAVDSEINIDISVRNNVFRDKDKPEAVVEINVIIGDKTKKCPFFIDIVEGAKFRWEVDNDEKKIEYLLTHNAPALLVSYLRPVVTVITSASQLPAYEIPFIDFNDSE